MPASVTISTRTVCPDAAPQRGSSLACALAVSSATDPGSRPSATCDRNSVVSVTGSASVAAGGAVDGEADPGDAAGGAVAVAGGVGEATGGSAAEPLLHPARRIAAATSAAYPVRLIASQPPR